MGAGGSGALSRGPGLTDVTHHVGAELANEPQAAAQILPQHLAEEFPHSQDAP